VESYDKKIMSSRKKKLYLLAGAKNVSISLEFRRKSIVLGVFLYVKTPCESENVKKILIKYSKTAQIRTQTILCT
jgi:hypothetical protein